MAPVLVLIAGPSGSGKSTLAKRLVELLSPHSLLFQQDLYFTNQYLPYKERIDESFEDGSAIDWEKLQRDMESSSVDKDFLVIEGHMLGGAESSVFLSAFHGTASIVIATIECTHEICKQRRLNRKARSKEEYEELSLYIDKYVSPSFLEFGLPAMTSLRNYGMENPGRNIQTINLLANKDDSLEPNAQKILTAVHQLTKDSLPKEKEELTEEWPSILNDNLQGFAQHHRLTVKLDQNASSFEVECVPSLTPLDMIHLSQGAHDATGSSIWMGAYNLIEAQSCNATIKSQNDNNKDDDNAANDKSPSHLRSCFHSKRVLELGCGTGTGGMSLLLSPQAWDCNPSHVCFTDNDDAVLALCRRNCEQNGCVARCCSFALLNWGSALQDQDLDLFDTVLATDVLYDLACLQPLLYTTVQSLRPLGIFALAHVPRSCLPEEPQTTTTTTTRNNANDYHASLENHIVKIAAENGLSLLAIIRPCQIQSAQGVSRLEPLNETSLVEMEEAGAAILVFQMTT